MRVPVLYQERDTPIHRRDPRAKVVLLVLLFVFLFVAPSWQWLTLPVALGLALAVVTRVPWRWIVGIWLLHVPTIIVLVVIPVVRQLMADRFEMTGGIETGLRLSMAWTASILVSVSLLSTLDADDLTDGLRGVGVPSVAAFAVGLSYRLLYVTLDEAARIVDAMRLKGMELRIRHPIRFVRGSIKASLPLLFAVLRRGPILMAALEMRPAGGERRTRQRLGGGDLLLIAVGLSAAATAVAARFGLVGS